jgi:hypothetical protein
MLMQVPATEIGPFGYSDDLGYLRCAPCATVTDKRTYPFRTLDAPIFGTENICHTCGKHLSTTERETIHGTATVEMMKCKIF